MLLKRSYFLLIIGGVLIVAGTIGLNWISIDIIEKYNSVMVIIPNQRITPQASYSAAFDLFLVEDSTLAIASRTPNAFLSMQLVDIDGQIIEESAFNDNLLIPLDELKTGTYQLTVTNFDDRTVTVNAVIAPEATLEQIEAFLDLAYNTLAASAVIFSGLVICLIGAIIWIIDRKKRNSA